MALTPEQIAAMDAAIGGIDADTIAKMDAVVSAPKRGLGKEAVRQVGLKAREAVEGVAAFPAMVADIPASIYNAGADLIQGDEGFRFMSTGPAISQMLSGAGLPQPENAAERVSGDITRALAGIATGGPLSKLAGAPKYVVDALSSKLGTQAASAIGSAGAAGLTREAGGGPIAQLSAALLGGVVPVGGYQVASRGLKDVYSAGKEAVKPFTTSGREQIVGGILAESADDAQRAAENLKNVKTYVPNSPITTAEAAGDVGLAGLQRGYRNQGANPFADIESQQNAARQAALEKVAGSKEGLEIGRFERDTRTAPMREAAFLNKRNVLPKEPLDEIEKILKSPVGKRDAVSSSMQWVRSKVLGTKNPEELYAIRQDINDAMQGKFDSDKPSLRLAKSQLKQVKDAIDMAIERGAPGFKKYIEQYAKESQPINQQELLQEVRNRVSLTGSPDINTGYEFLSQPKLTSVLRDEGGDLARTLSPEQMSVLRNISKDMERSASLNARNIRATGSDTAANLNAGKVVKNFLSEHAAGKLPLGIGRILQNMSEKQINELTVEALKDPQLARRLLVELKPEVVSQPYSGAATQALVAQILGSLRGATATQNQKVE